jgi:hypothetical protein
VLGVDPELSELERRIVEHGAGSCQATIVGGELRFRL